MFTKARKSTHTSFNDPPAKRLVCFFTKSARIWRNHFWVFTSVFSLTLHDFPTSPQ